MDCKIYHKDGSVLTDVNGKAIDIHSLEYNGEWMGECAVSTRIENEAPIVFSSGDWLLYRDERYELNYDPGKLKQGSKDVLGDAFVYESVKWNALSDELARSEFLDVVYGDDNQQHYTALPDFTFYIDTLDDLLDRLQANMDEQTGVGLWKFYSRSWSRSRQRGCDAKRWEDVYGEKVENAGNVVSTVINSASISVQSQSVWDGLSLVNSQFDVNFIVRNREVFIDTFGIITDNIFQYGKGKGLYEIEQQAQSDQKIVNRLRAYGSSKNLPTRYYATLNTEVWTRGSGLWRGWHGGVLNNISFDTELSADSISAYFKNPYSGGGAYSATIRVGIYTATAEITKGMNGRCKVYVNVDFAGGATPLSAIAEAVDAGQRVYFVSGVNKANFPDNRKDYATKNLPDNMACDRLMLPGFPNKSLQDWWNAQDAATKNRLNPTGALLRFSDSLYRPWVETADAEDDGVRGGSVFFDTEDTKNKIEEIYPTLEEMVIDGVRVDEIWVGTSIEDNGVFKEGVTVPGFTITLRKELDIDLNGLKDDDFSVVMKDGMCSGRTFKVSGCVKKDGCWVLTLNRTEDGTNQYFPNRDFQIRKGDHFVLTGIEMPDAYIEAASEKLLMYAIKWLLANSKTRYTYQPKVDELFMARQHDAAMADSTGATKSLHDILKEGDLMQFEDADLGIGGMIAISHLTIREEDGKIPTYEITLSDKKDVGSLEKMQEQIDAIATGGGGLSSGHVKTLVKSEGEKWFLSKTKEDTAHAAIDFEKGLTTGAYKRGASGAAIDANGAAEVKNMAAREGVTVGDDAFVRADGGARLGDVEVARVRSKGAEEGDRNLISGRGFDLFMGADGKSHLWVDDANIRGKLVAMSTEIRKVSYSGGTLLLSNAGSTLARVTAVTDDQGAVVAYKCWAKADDGTTQTMNWWRIGMMALCQTFNVSGNTGGNRRYWRLVVGVGQERLDDGKIYDYVLLSNIASFSAVAYKIPYYSSGGVLTAKGDVLRWAGEPVGMVQRKGNIPFLIAFALQEGSAADVSTIKDDDGVLLMNRGFYGYEPTADGGAPDAPMAGDVIVQCGDQVRWLSRGNVIRLCTSSDDGDINTTPSLSMYHGIGRLREVIVNGEAKADKSVWQWRDLTALISPTKTYINSDYFYFFSEDNGGIEKAQSFSEFKMQSDKVAVSVRDVATGVEKAGVHLNGDDSCIVAKANKFYTENSAGVRTTSVDEEGNLIARSLHSLSVDDEKALRVDIENGMMTMATSQSNAKIMLGLDEDGLPAFIFYNADSTIGLVISANGTNAKPLFNPNAVIVVDDVITGSYSYSVGPGPNGGKIHILSYTVKLTVKNNSGNIKMIKDGVVTVKVKSAYNAQMVTLHSKDSKNVLNQDTLAMTFSGVETFILPTTSIITIADTTDVTVTNEGGKTWTTRINKTN